MILGPVRIPATRVNPKLNTLGETFYFTSKSSSVTDPWLSCIRSSCTAAAFLPFAICAICMSLNHSVFFFLEESFTIVFTGI